MGSYPILNPVDSTSQENGEGYYYCTPRINSLYSTLLSDREMGIRQTIKRLLVIRNNNSRERRNV